MIDGSNDTIPSAVAQVAKLKLGEAYCRARFLRSVEANPDAIKAAKYNLRHLLGPVVARAREQAPGNQYTVHSIHAFTESFDVVIAGVVVRIDRREEL